VLSNKKRGMVEDFEGIIAADDTQSNREKLIEKNI
jgi:hypothetical protein